MAANCQLGGGGVVFAVIQQKPFFDMAASHQFARPFGGSVRCFRQRVTCSGSVLVRRFVGSEGNVHFPPLPWLRWTEESMTCTAMRPGNS